MTLFSRRRFLEDSMFAATAAALAGSTAARVQAEEEPQSTSPNERLGVAVIGVRGQGGGHLGAYSSRQDTEVIWVCDADREV
ncbi:MAG: gfo/Idh/MocA family oxidoreductase, partial [Pirellulales bacterium]